MRFLRAFGSCAALVWSLGACDDETLGVLPPDGGHAVGCKRDEDCGPRQRCNADLRICFSLDECDRNEDCSTGQVCGDNNQDGYRDCYYERCDEDADCATLVCPHEKVKRCVQGGCICGEPCQGGCRDGQGCCIMTNVCHTLPAECADLRCSPGEFITVTSSGSWDTGQCRVTGETCACAKLPPLPLGDVGLHSAMAHDGRTAVVSAYNLTYGDLMYGVVQPNDSTIHWEFVDGVPTSTTAITGAIDGPRGGQAEEADDVGIYSDITTDALGRPHVVYHDRTHGALKYALGRPDGWRIHTIEASAQSGMYASITLSRSGQPRIAYLTLREDSGSTRMTTLRLAVSASDEPGQRSDWTIRDADQLDLAPLGCDERCRPAEVCRSSDQKCVTPDPVSCPGGCSSTETRCINGQCERIEPVPTFRDVPKARGLWPAIQELPDGTVLIAYHDNVAGTLKMASFAGPNPAIGAMVRATIDDGAGAETVGAYPSLFVTPGGEIHLAYANTTQRSLIYRSLGAQLETLIEEVVDSENRTSLRGDFGADPALVVDGAGVVRIAYQQASQGELRYARRTGSDVWNVVTLRGNEEPYAGSFGFYTDQVLGANRTGALVSTYRYLLSGPPGNGLEIVTPP